MTADEQEQCYRYPWCGCRCAGDETDHFGTIATLTAGASTVEVTVFMDDAIGKQEFSVEFGEWKVARGSAVSEVRDMRIIANKVEALLTTWTPDTPPRVDGDMPASNIPVLAAAKGISVREWCHRNLGSEVTS